jgi:quinolinate synthase
MINVTELQPGAVDRFETTRRTPPANLDTLSRDILALKKKLNAVILAHNYQVPEIQDIADYVGDSPRFGPTGAKTRQTSLCFAAFTSWRDGENPESQQNRGVCRMRRWCSLEESCPGPKLKALQDTNPNFWTIAYINCSAR